MKTRSRADSQQVREVGVPVGELLDDERPRYTRQVMGEVRFECRDGQLFPGAHGGAGGYVSKAVVLSPAQSPSSVLPTV